MTGHRMLAEVDRIVRGVDAALAAIRTAYPDRPLRIVSSLAEGADRLVAERARRLPDASLAVVLPIARTDYLADFAGAASREAFARLIATAVAVHTLPPTTSRDAAYEAAGRYVLDHSDVLVAVWDGEPPQGVGGTGEMVMEARRRGMPLAWVHAGNRRPGTSEPTTLGSDQGSLTLERLPIG